jgi:hypothetical protein
MQPRQTGIDNPARTYARRADSAARRSASSTGTAGDYLRDPIRLSHALTQLSHDACPQFRLRNVCSIAFSAGDQSRINLVAIGV